MPSQNEGTNAGRVPAAPVATRNAIVVQGARNGAERFAAGKPRLDLLPYIHVLDRKQAVPAWT